ncbi:hypothetical protein IRZ83_13170 [Flavobacterium sp. JLP]|uniref:hypothetical protein n=1 Tax=Flavobacterium sp. JLP TaxID=2783793 RepID=UPI00188A29BB|nr:hypothetical protein [Flavobacterium sp. JLP]MBF4507620.1 hypothetical protein [Flavobacterium sp. JLP]
MTSRIFSFLLFIGLISCKKTEVHVNKFVGTWYDTEYVIPNLTIIKIKEDSTFSCVSGACTWHGFSRGKWKVTGDFIELNTVKIDSCYDVFPFFSCRFFDKNNEAKMTIEGCKPKSPDSYVIFENENFYIKNDSLILQIKPSSGCPDTLKIVFAKTQKIRK